MIRKLALGMLLLAGLDTPNLQAQLAITEVMSRASLETVIGPRRPDYWELTNYGTNDISLDGYWFSDERGINGLIPNAFFNNVIIHTNETIVIFKLETDLEDQSSVTNAEQFRAWWGEALSPSLQILMWEGSGLNGESPGDEVWLYDPQLNVVDHVKFREAWDTGGRAFVCDPDTGVFGVWALPGVNGGYQAALGGDYGSPGIAPPRSPLRIVQHPAGQVVDAGASATFSVIAYGLPRPKYQWLAGGIEIPGATEATLTISNVQPEEAGEYCVRVCNGLSEMTSLAATLTVEMNPNPPVIVSPPQDLGVYPNQTVVFSVLARGFPAPQYQWESNGVEIAGATSPTLTLERVAPGMDGTVYTVRIWNYLGATNASATLTVAPRRPRLQFTEVMNTPITADSSSHYDWFEITSYETNTVSLQGYRFADRPLVACAYTITEPLLIKPGESIVFVEEMSAESFWRWWGFAHFRTGMQVHTFNGFSLADVGESLTLWNPAAINDADSVASIAWLLGTVGVSLECTADCDEEYGCMGMCLTDSVLGVNGAFRAAVNGDIGSPGCITNLAPMPVPPRFLSIAYDGSRILLECAVTPGKTYRLSCTPELPAAEWTELDTYVPSDPLLWIEDAAPAPAAAPRFYRLEEIIP